MKEHLGVILKIKVRWQYCALPHNSGKQRYYIICCFFYDYSFSNFCVKMIFRYEYFADFVSRITGGKLVSETVSNIAGTAPGVS